MVDESRLKDFLWFMCERQRIWCRRHVKQEDPPWTENSILKNYHFCNVYRALDSTTQYVIDNVLRDDDPRNVILNTVIFRLLNKPKSYEVMGGYTPADEFDVDQAVERLRLWGEHNTVFSPAYRVPAHRFAGSDSKVENIFYGIIRDDLMEHLDDYTNCIVHADSLKQAHSALEHLRGVGDFLAYEFVTDLNYQIIDFCENDFVNVGPGAQRGVELIWGEGVTDYEDKIRYLVRYDDALFQQFDLDFPYWSEKPELTCRDFEHSMCEWRKWWQVKHGGSTRRFEPDDPKQRDMDDFV